MTTYHDCMSTQPMKTIDIDTGKSSRDQEVAATCSASILNRYTTKDATPVFQPKAAIPV